MGIDISLQDESGEILEHILDPQNYLHELLPSYNDHSYQFLRFIDWYGVTIFNQMQMKGFIAEWKRLHNKVKSEKEKKLVSKIENMARICQEEIGLLLKFQGD